MAPHLEAYEACSRGRGESGFIPPSAVLAYCELLGIDDVEQRASLLRVVNAVDAALVSSARDKRERLAKKKPEA